MKTSTYLFLRCTPFVGSVVKIKYEPIGLFGSLERGSGYTDKTLELYKEYSKSHPGEYLSRQLVSKLWNDYYANGGTWEPREDY